MRNRVYSSLILVSLLCLVGWTGYAQGQRTNPARQAWEYKTLSFIVQGTVPARTTLYEDGKQVPGSTPVSRAPELGAQGWELVSIAATVSGDYSTYIYWFKRPK
jgi:hypothetical protein